MTSVDMHMLPAGAPTSKTTISIPDEQWSRMTQHASIRVAAMTRTVTRAYDGTRVVVDAHDGGTTVIWTGPSPMDERV